MLVNERLEAGRVSRREMMRLLPRGMEKARKGGRINKNLVVGECVW